MNGVNHLSNQPDVLSHQELADIAEKTLLTIKKVQRTNEKIQTELGRRSINTIINSGETCYMGACVDMTLAMLMKLKEFIPAKQLQIGCELLQQKETGNLTFHLFLQDNSVQPRRILDFVRNNEVKIYEGNYSNPTLNTKISHLGTYTLSAEQINLDDNFLSLAQKMNIQLPPQLFEAYLAKLQHDNTSEQFQNFCQNSAEIKIQLPASPTTNALIASLSQSPDHI